jgi:hypothetical protein
MASLRKLVITILRLTGAASIAAALRYRARRPARPLQTIMQLLATSLYDDPAAGLHEDASARLREYLALPACSISPQSSPGVRRGLHTLVGLGRARLPASKQEQPDDH